MNNLRAFRFIKLFLTGWLLVSCGGGEPPSPGETIAETWIVRDYEAANLDSLAFWKEENWLLVTAKSTHEIIVLDAESGRFLKRFGESGVQAGNLLRPNGIAVMDNVLFIVERDNHRVQMFSLPECRSLGFFGSDRLKRPYGIALYKDGEERIQIYVTDNHQPDSPTESDLKERVKHFEVDKGPDGIEAKWIRSFGDSDKPGALYKVESIAVDPGFNRLLIAEENGLRIKIYNLEGQFTGLLAEKQMFHFEPEGIALYHRPEQKGIWVMVDQKDQRTHFMLFDRKTLKFLGLFSGEMVANTDGITLTELALPEFPEGALFAVHDDAGVAALPWTDIADLID